MTHTDTPLVDVRDMLVVHTALLREFRLMPAAVARTAPGDLAAAAAVDRHLRFLCELLHHHHEGEDVLLWPRLRDRVPASVHALLDEVESQHAGLDAVLARTGTARDRWAADPTTDHRDGLVTELERLHLLLRDHLDLEETAVLPLAASTLTEQEWKGVGDAAAAAMPKPALMLAFGMFAYEGDPQVLRAMLASAPGVARLVIPRVAPRVYARRARAVHGTDRP